MKRTVISKSPLSKNSLLKRLCFAGLGFALLGTLPVNAKDYLVADQAEYAKVAASLKAGDSVILKDGIWRDFEILFQGNGSKQQPIKLTSQTKGEVILSGESNLSLAGEYLEVSGLVFKNGHTPTSAVIQFRKDKNNLANHSRVTETVIDNYSNPERFENDYWVAMYGKHNRFDHNHLEGKSNKGVTMAVRLNTPESQENYHRIDHNYFGPRSILGSNGGETLRVGTSHYSLKNSYTVIENNYFDRCDGELEIISNKSGFNVFRGNVFFESRGTMTLRHGNDNLMENNVFFGNGVDHTGGIRLINKRQTIRNNYIEGLAGYRFGGALVVMNGVPNSPINRYHQVEDSLIEGNSLINVEHIQLAAGSDAERSAVPVDTRFENNLIYNENSKDTFTVYDDVSGIKFAGNAINQVASPTLIDGFDNQQLKVERAANGLVYVTEPSAVSAGVARDLAPIAKQDVGTSWYPKPERRSKFDFGKTINIEPGLDTLTKAIKSAQNGDIIKLAAGDYTVARVITLDKGVTVKGDGNDAVTLRYERGALFEIQHGGSLMLDGLTITGAESPDSSGNTVIRTVRKSMLTNYDLVVKNTKVIDLDINHTFNFLSINKGTFADRIEIKDSHFSNITGAIVKLDQENDDFGIYNAEYVTIQDSVFENVKGALVDMYRGGTDESTFGPHLVLQDSLIRNVGKGKRNKSKSAVRIHGVQVAKVHSNTFEDSAGFSVLHTVGEPVTKITKNVFSNTQGPTVQELNSDKTDTADLSGNVIK